nr:hypothetical protein PanWU01x14_049760 [Ipomoea trifida]
MGRGGPQGSVYWVDLQGWPLEWASETGPWGWPSGPAKESVGQRPSLTSSSQNFLYSNVSPADFENSTTVTSGATSNTSAVTDSFPFRPSLLRCIFTLNSFEHSIRKFNFLHTDSSFSKIAGAENFEVKSDPDLLRLLSKRLDKSNPEDMDDMSSNAL